MKTCYVAPILALILLAGMILYTLLSRRENYKDPLYLNRDKMVRDWYPRSNGSIYGVGSDYYVEPSNDTSSSTYLELRPYNKIYYADKNNGEGFYQSGLYYGKTKTSNRSHNLFSGVTYLDTVL